MADNVVEVICEVCGKSNPKYRCPGCARRTCSLACVKCHKTQFQCSGVRCKTKFVSVDKYKDSDLLSDYRFLEDVDRLAYTATHNGQRFWKTWTIPMLVLRRKTRNSGVNWRVMPSGMSKRKENSSMFSKKSKCILWRIQWLFPQAGVEYVDKWVSELAIISDVLKKYIDPEEAVRIHKQSLKNYCGIGVQGVFVFLKVEPVSASQPRYYQLDTSKTLKECLTNKTIVEFPTLHVVLPDKTASYPTCGGEYAKSAEVKEKESISCRLLSLASMPSSQISVQASEDM